MNTEGLNRRLFLTYLLIWCFWHFPWVSAVFYLGSFPAAEWFKLSLQSLGAWLICFTPAAAYLFIRLRSLKRSLADINNADNTEKVRLAGVLLRLPTVAAAFFTLAWLAASGIVYLIWLGEGMSILSAYSIWVGGVGGALCMPWAIYGLFSYQLGSWNAELSLRLSKVGLGLPGKPTSIRMKIAWSVITFVFGYSIWMGGLGYYTGIRQTINEMKYELKHEYRRLKTAATDLSFKRRGSLADFFDRLSLSEEHDARALAYFILDDNRGVFFRRNSSRAKPNLTLLDVRNAPEGRVVGFDHHTNMVYILGDLSGSYRLIVTAALGPRLSRMNYYLAWLGVFALGGCLAIAVIALSLAGGIARSVDSIYEMTSDIAAGRLIGGKGARNHDEIGGLTLNLTGFFDHLASMVITVRSGSGNMVGSVQSVLADLTGLSDNAVQQASSIQQASASMEELTAGFETVAKSADGQSDSLVEISRRVEAMGTTMDEVAQLAADVRRRSDESTQAAEDSDQAADLAIDAITSMADSAEKIIQSIQIINEIADRTSLLSLNASIEAARAGEAGRGFSIVAQEISRLAEQSTGATQSIEARIRETRGIVRESLEKVRALSNLIDAMRSAAGLTGELGERAESAAALQQKTGRSVIEAVHQVTKMAGDIAVAQTEHLDTAREMMSVITTLGGMADNSVSKYQSIQRAADELNGEIQEFQEQTESLGQAVQGFK